MRFPISMGQKCWVAWFFQWIYTSHQSCFTLKFWLIASFQLKLRSTDHAQSKIARTKWALCSVMGGLALISTTFSHSCLLHQSVRYLSKPCSLSFVSYYYKVHTVHVYDTSQEWKTAETAGKNQQGQVLCRIWMAHHISCSHFGCIWGVCKGSAAGTSIVSTIVNTRLLRTSGAHCQQAGRILK